MPAFSFDAIAPWYDRLAKLMFGKAIENAQTCFLSAIPENAHVLLIGGGTGWILAKLLALNNCRRIEYIEASAHMLDLSRQAYTRIRAAYADTEVCFIHGTEKDIPEASCYDAILTFFVLDLHTEQSLPAMMQPLYAHLKKQGCWFFADFKESAHYGWHKGLIRLMQLFFRVTANIQIHPLPDYGKAFRSYGLKREAARTFYRGLIHSEVYRRP